MDLILSIWIIGIVIHFLLVIGMSPIREIIGDLKHQNPTIRAAMRKELMITAINIIAWPISWTCELVRDIKRGRN